MWRFVFAPFHPERLRQQVLNTIADLNYRQWVWIIVCLPYASGPVMEVSLPHDIIRRFRHTDFDSLLQFQSMEFIKIIPDITVFDILIHHILGFTTWVVPQVIFMTPGHSMHHPTFAIFKTTVIRFFETFFSHHYCQYTVISPPAPTPRWPRILGL